MSNYKLNSVDLADYGILPGQISDSNIAMSGIFDLPARSGTCFYEWAESIEPYVDADEIFFSGRDLSFAGIILGSVSEIKDKLRTFYSAIGLFSDLVIFSTPFGDFSGYVKSIAPEVSNGGCKFTLMFREPVYLLPVPMSIGNIANITSGTMEVGVIDNWTGVNKTKSTDIRSKIFTDFTKVDKLTLKSPDNVAFSVYFYDKLNAFIFGMEHSISFDPAFITGYLNSKGQLKATEILKSI